MSEKVISSPETEPQHYGVAIKDIDAPLWDGILDIYLADAFDNYQFNDKDWFRESLTYDVLTYRRPIASVTDLRIGSKFSHNSKLTLQPVYGLPERAVQFGFYVNEKLFRDQIDEAQEVARKFAADVDQFLQASGKAVAIPER